MSDGEREGAVGRTQEALDGHVEAHEESIAWEEYNKGMQEFRENELVQYYLEGWRAGYVVSQVGKLVKIQPIPASLRPIKIPVEDIKRLQK